MGEAVLCGYRATKCNRAQFDAISALKLKKGKEWKWSVQAEVQLASADG